MPTNRITPYGYCIKKGQNEIDQEECKILNQIYDMRIEEKSLSEIMLFLLDKEIPYSEESMAWNKAKLMRILEDKRYLGNEEFPQAISKEKFEAAQKIGALHKTNSQRSGATPEIKEIRHMITCGKCGNLMRRRYERQAVKQPIRWICQNADCKLLVPMGDTELLAGILKTLSQVKEDEPNGTSSFYIPTNEILRQEKALLRRIDQSSPEEAEELQKIVRDLVIQKYMFCMDEKEESHRIYALVREAEEQDAFNVELVKQTVLQIVLGPEDNIGLLLKDRRNIQGKTEREVNPTCKRIEKER